jgi:hypothetical protein
LLRETQTRLNPARGYAIGQRHRTTLKDPVKKSLRGHLAMLLYEQVQDFLLLPLATDRWRISFHDDSPLLTPLDDNRMGKPGVEFKLMNAHNSACSFSLCFRLLHIYLHLTQMINAVVANNKTSDFGFLLGLRQRFLGSFSSSLSL